MKICSTIKTRLIIVGLLVFSINKLNAQLYLENNSNETISVCLGWYNQKIEAFSTKGWYVLKPDEKLNPSLYFTSNNDEFYFHATSPSRSWGTDYRLLSKQGAFEVHYANLAKTKSYDNDLNWTKFDKITVAFGLFEERTFTLKFGKSEEQINEELLQFQSINGTYSNFSNHKLIIKNCDKFGCNYKLAFYSQDCEGLEDLSGYAEFNGQIWKGESFFFRKEEGENGVIFVEPEIDYIGNQCARSFDSYFSKDY